jgi:hypothetical protein
MLYDKLKSALPLIPAAMSDGKVLVDGRSWIMGLRGRLSQQPTMLL